VQNPRRQAEELLGDALGIKRLQLYMEFDRPLTNLELDRCRAALMRRGQGEPLQYIHGEVEFHHCRFKVNRSVLIPRQETEILVDKVIQVLKNQELEGRVLWDLCSGSGCIGISLKKQFPQLQVFLSDLSAEALQVAKANAVLNDCEVTLVQGDLLKPFKDQRANFILCNPPYVSENEWNKLDIEVRNYEPKQALVGGVTGLEYYELLAKALPEHLYPQGKVWMEMGTGQGDSIKNLFNSPIWIKKELEKDWAGHDRFFSLEIE
jgi:release factor glutamine methyltransferase